MLPFTSEPAPRPALPESAVLARESVPTVLVGPLGLRAGWGILLFSAIALVLILAFSSALGGVGRLKAAQAERQLAQKAAQRARANGTEPPPQLVPLGSTGIVEFSQAAAVLLAGVCLSYLERRQFAVYGLPARGTRNLLSGAVWGLLSATLLVSLLRCFHLVVFDEQLLHGQAIVRYGALWLAVYLLVGVFEEFSFRGYLQFTLMRGLLGLSRRIAPGRERTVAFWLSALLWSFVFFAAHSTNTGENPAGLLGVFLAGILFSYALWRTGSLWWGVGFHMSWDWGQSFLFGVADSGTLSVSRLFQTHPAGNPLLSGGVDGPEGSLLLTPVFLLMFLVIRLHPEAAQPPVEPQW